VGVVELLVRPHVDEHRPVGPLLLDLARRQRQQLDAVGEQRPAIEVDDDAEVRRLRAEAVQRVLDELVLVRDRQHRVVPALEADRGRHLHVHPRAAAHRAAEVTGPDLDVLAQREQLAVQRPEDPPRPLGLLDRQVRPRDVADEQRVAGQHRPRLLAAARVDQREGRVLGPVPGRVERLHDQPAELPRGAVVERLVGVVGLGRAVDVNGGAGRGR
jgi:hypothetical protein